MDTLLTANRIEQEWRKQTKTLGITKSPDLFNVVVKYSAHIEFVFLTLVFFSAPYLQEGAIHSIRD